MKYDENLVQEDLDFFLSLLRFPNSVSYVDEAVCMYRIHNNNSSKTNNNIKRIINQKSFLMTVEKYINHYQLSNYLLPVKYKSKAKIYYLEKKYFKCVVNMSASLLLRFKSRLFS